MMNAMQKTLGEITETRVEQAGPKGQEFTYVDIGSIELGTKRIVDPKVLPVSKAPSRAKQILKSGDVLVSMTRPNRNAVALVPPELDGAIASTGFHVLRAQDVEPGFLFYAVQTNDFIDALCEKVQGALYPAVRPRDISSFKTILPASLTEQRRIVAEIEKQFTRLEVGVTALRRVQANLKRYRAAVLKAACEGRLVPTEAEYFPSLENYGPPNRLPKGWRWTTAVEICEQVVDCHNKTAPYTESGIPLVRTTNIRDGKIDLAETRFVDQPTYEFWSRRCTPKSGDILFTREAPMGEAGIIPDGVVLCMGQRMMLLRASPMILNRYLLAALLTPGLIAHIARTAVGSGVKHLRVSDVEALPIPLPPLTEQIRIVTELELRLSVVEELETVVFTNLQRATRLRQSVLQKAFSGKLAISAQQKR